MRLAVTRSWQHSVVMLLWPALLTGQPATDAELYQSACAACHGDDGRGRSVEEVAFSTPLPDFTNCSFASREPDPDWHAVIQEGGPVRAFDRMMPAFGDVLSDAEIYSVLRHVRTFCVDDRWPRGEFNRPRPLFTEKAYPEDEVVVTTTADSGGAGGIEGEFLYEKRIGPAGMVEAAVPLAYGDSGNATGAMASIPGRTLGASDVSFGYKRTVHHDLCRGSIFSLGAEAVLASEPEVGGSVDRAPIIEPFAAYAHLLPGDGFVQTQALAALAAGGDAHHAAELRLALGQDLGERRVRSRLAPDGGSAGLARPGAGCVDARRPGAAGAGEPEHATAHPAQRRCAPAGRQGRRTRGAGRRLSPLGLVRWGFGDGW